EPAENAPVDLIAGEALAVNNRILMFKHTPKDEIQSIEVFNEHGTYKFYRDSSDNFCLEGYPVLAYNQELFASLVVSAGYTITLMKVMDNATEADLAEFGLDKPIARWTVTSTSGEEHTVYIGDNLITEGGYYAQYKGRDSIYILSNTLESTILQPVEKLIAPYLTAGVMSQNDYFYATNFTIWRNEELFLRIANVDPSKMADPNAIMETEMIYPKGYKPHDNNYFVMLYDMMSLQGSEAVKVGPTKEDLETYGLAKPAYSVYYMFKNLEFYMHFSEKQADNTYYVTSNISNYKLIAKIPASSVSWLDQGLFYWIAEYPFNVNITTVKSMDIKADGLDITFSLIHGKDASGNNTLEVDADVRAAKETAAPAKIHLSMDEVYTYRQFFRTLLAINLQEESPLSEEEKTALMADDSKLILSFSYTTTKGVTTEYKFYQYSTRRALVTVNGHGEFYTNIDLLTKAANDAEKVLQVIDIDSYGKN
ncbi:MAG: DUF4340 domain-containing protein, partial [Clostridia bacterium]|nr:DUF4340 domain-containing protein [Clostridia bacterium]